MEEKKPSSGSNITNLEWGLVIGAMALIDAAQIGFDLLFGSGIIINRFIDIAVGMFLSFYFYIRGVKMNAKKILGLLASFLLKEIPIVDALPLWTLDVVVVMAWDKAEGKIEGVIPILDKAEKIAGKVGSIAGKRIGGKGKKSS